MVLAAPLVVGGMLLTAMNFLIGVVATPKVNPIVVYAAAIIGLLIYSVIVTVIMAYIKTTFVLWAEDQNVFAANRPEYSRLLTDAAGEAGEGHHVIPDADMYQMQQEQPEPPRERL